MICAQLYSKLFNLTSFFMCSLIGFLNGQNLKIQVSLVRIACELCNRIADERFLPNHMSYWEDALKRSMISSNLHYFHDISSKRVRSGWIHLRGLVAGSISAV